MLSRRCRPASGSIGPALALLCATATAVPAAELSVGDLAPRLEALDDSGQVWNSADVFGKSGLVLFFYPAAMTGG